MNICKQCEHYRVRGTNKFCANPDVKLLTFNKRGKPVFHRPPRSSCKFFKPAPKNMLSDGANRASNQKTGKQAIPEQSPVNSSENLKISAKLVQSKGYVYTQFYCERCNNRLLGKLEQVDREIMCCYCGWSGKMPSVLCNQRSCNGILEKCGGIIRMVDNEGEYNIYVCSKCQKRYQERKGRDNIAWGDNKCKEVICNKCKHTPDWRDNYPEPDPEPSQSRKYIF